MSCIYGGFIAGPHAVKYAHGLIKSGNIRPGTSSTPSGSGRKKLTLA